MEKSQMKGLMDVGEVTEKKNMYLSIKRSGDHDICSYYPVQSPNDKMYSSKVISILHHITICSLTSDLSKQNFEEIIHFQNFSNNNHHLL